MTTTELLAKIKDEIERQMCENPEVEYDNGFNDALDYLLYFLNTLEKPKIVDGEDETELNSFAYLEQLGYTCIPPGEEPKIEPDIELKKEIEKKYDQAKWGYVDGVGSVVMDKGQFIRIARHFAQWGARYRDLTKSGQVTQCVLSEPEQKPVPQELKVASVQIADNLLSKPRDYALASKADYWNGARDGVIAGAEWQEKRNLRFGKQVLSGDFTVFETGRKYEREQMLKEAVEGIVMNFSSKEPKPTVIVDAKGFNQGDKVRIIIVKEDEK